MQVLGCVVTSVQDHERAGINDKSSRHCDLVFDFTDSSWISDRTPVVTILDAASVEGLRRCRWERGCRIKGVSLDNSLASTQILSFYPASLDLMSSMNDIS